MSNPSSPRPIKRALISVSDKTGIAHLAQQLANAGVHILSTGGTATLLKSAGIAVTDVREHTQFPEIMAGRVKTLHPKIHGGILARAEIDDAVMQQHDIAAIDLVIVNLYPFAATLTRADCTLDLAIENIDIGGPAMVRAAAKNHSRVGVIVDPEDYADIMRELEANEFSLKASTRFELARKAFSHTAEYDGMIANYFGVQNTHEYPDHLHLSYTKRQALRYGENPHQTASFYAEVGAADSSIASARLIQGKELSFNNIADSDAALQCVKQFSSPACVIVKHANPCGVATGDTIGGAYQRAYQTDPTSAFGGIIAFNQTLDADTAADIVKQQFVEVILAPGIEADAQAILSNKPNTRVLDYAHTRSGLTGFDTRRVSGGLLVQQHDDALLTADDLKIVSHRPASSDEVRDCLFAWKIAKFVKSNAIVYARDEQSIGIGAGQMSRIYSAKIAGIKAQDENLTVAGSVMASDAFFPFRDAIDTAHQTGISCIIQPGGSRNDSEIIAAADEHGMAMLFTGQRHFRH